MSEIKLSNLDHNALDYIKSNIDKNLDRYLHGDEEWLLEFLIEKGINPSISKVLLKKVTLDTSSEVENLTDAENAIRLHKNLKGLSRSDASYGGLWTYLTHCVFWDYMKYRWGLTEISKKRPTTNEDRISRISTRYVLSGDASHRELARNGLSRLWWAAELSYDQNQDSYELTKTMFDLQDIVGGILERDLTCNKNITIPLLRWIKKYKEEGRPELNNMFLNLMKHLNSAAGALMLDSMNGDSMIQMFENYAKWWLKNNNHMRTHDD